MERLYNLKIVRSGDRTELYKYNSFLKIGNECANKKDYWHTVCQRVKVGSIPAMDGFDSRSVGYETLIIWSYR